MKSTYQKEKGVKALRVHKKFSEWGAKDLVEMFNSDKPCPQKKLESRI